MACSTHEQWWQIIFAEYLTSLQKIEKWRKQRRQQEMEECTFRPYLIGVGRIGKVLLPVAFPCWKIQ
jgi:hypothetical protein